jgi:tetratricopeptide (TPR) repeat protein
MSSTSMIETSLLNKAKELKQKFIDLTCSLYCNMSIVFFKYDQFQQAFNCASHALQYDIEYPKAYYYKGKCFKSVGQYVEAYEQYEKCSRFSQQRQISTADVDKELNALNSMHEDGIEGLKREKEEQLREQDKMRQLFSRMNMGGMTNNHQQREDEELKKAMKLSMEEFEKEEQKRKEEQQADEEQNKFKAFFEEQEKKKLEQENKHQPTEVDHGFHNDDDEEFVLDEEGSEDDDDDEDDDDEEEVDHNEEDEDDIDLDDIDPEELARLEKEIEDEEGGDDDDDDE